MLNLWLDCLFGSYGAKGSFAIICLAPMLDVVEGHKFLFVAKTFHVPILNLKMKCKWLGKCAPMSYVLIFNLLWVLNRCMMPTNEKSHI
jgi:hypothetical protein